MTTYAFRITLNDSEMITVQAALEHFRGHCEASMPDGPVAPFWAHLRSIDDILSKLHADAQMTSTSSYCWPKVPD